MCYNIKLDLKQRTYDIIEAQQNDDIVVEFEIFDNGIIVDLKEKAILIKMSTPSKRYIIQSDNFTVSENKVLAKLNRNISKEIGTGLLNITVLTLDSVQDSTFNIPVIIHGGAISENLLVEDDVITLLDDLDDKIAEAAITKENIVNAINLGDLVKVRKDIDSNASKIFTNTSNITENSNDIASNSSGISKNSTKINENKKSIDAINNTIKTITNEASLNDIGYFKDKKTGLIFQWINRTITLNNGEGMAEGQLPLDFPRSVLFATSNIKSVDGNRAFIKIFNSNVGMVNNGYYNILIKNLESDSGSSCDLTALFIGF